MRTVAVVTVARSDYGIYLPILHGIQAAPGLHLHLIVSGAHLAPEFGLSINDIIADGFPVGDRVEMLLSSDSPEGTAKSLALGVSGFAQVFARSRPDLVVVLGGRFEMFAAALAALPFALPVAHVHGGELTQGAMDDAIRHAMTKLSHLHFVATAEYGRRVEQLGEESWRVCVSGAPALDNIGRVPVLSPQQLADRFGVVTDPAPLLVTFHPVTLEQGLAEAQMQALLSALDAAAIPVVFTQPNADPGGRRLSLMIDEFVSERNSAVRVDNLGLPAYFSLMRLARAMVGNSSSGLIEAPSFRLPVVNIGNRQAGRVRAANVIDCAADETSILNGIRLAIDGTFRQGLRGLVNPYGDGQASAKIVARLADVTLDGRLIAKVFNDVSAL